MVCMNPTLENFEFCIDTGAFATRCKEITTLLMQDLVEEKDPDGGLEQDILSTEQNNLKQQIEKIKFDIKYATQKE